MTSRRWTRCWTGTTDLSGTEGVRGALVVEIDLFPGTLVGVGASLPVGDVEVEDVVVERIGARSGDHQPFGQPAGVELILVPEVGRNEGHGPTEATPCGGLLHTVP